ncbi:glucose-6-phosphatase 3 isoform X2 [Corythoichthys intestinalis]|uniref:glucose-6-phosphatase 3 isoform X2 n=1 Tax=Corythoichthys intestinalis TaxID=161448 RepID=UPI0025A61C18|nr:glucose-6-phosphatase 3 isoform X2 [Corythoichthys intestinalis]
MGHIHQTLRHAFELGAVPHRFSQSKSVAVILKHSVLFGERPFWWIPESHIFANKLPKLEQYSSTCENGPGSPSGHAMVTAAVWYVVASSLHSYLYRRNCSIPWTYAPYVLYGTLLAVVCISRVFVLAHFPHQVFTGSIAGLLLGIYLLRRVPERRPLQFFMALTSSLMIGTLALNAALRTMGVDLSWSMALAKKWCKHSEWVRPDVATLTSLSRDCGALLGMGLAQHWKPGGWQLARGPQALSLVLSYIALYFVCSAPLPLRSPVLYYTLFSVKFTLVPLIVVMVPGLVHLMMRKIKRN